MTTVFMILSICAGACIGAVGRFLLSFIPLWGTLVANCLGGFIMGLLFVFFEQHLFSQNLRLFLLTGFLGSLTTFSTFSIETTEWLLKGHYGQAVLYIFLNVGLSIGLCISGVMIMRYIYQQESQITYEFSQNNDPSLATHHTPQASQKASE